MAKEDSSPTFSIIIPIHNEAESIDELFAEIQAVMATLDDSYEIIYVNDGSTDNSAEVLDRITRENDFVHCLQHRQRRGKSFAYSSAFATAKGEALITIDGDLQDDPAEIVKLLAVYQEGFDLVVAAKSNRLQTEFWRKLPSIVFNFLLRLAFNLDLKDSNSGFRIMSREVVASLPLYGDRYRFIPQLAHIEGFRVGEVAVIHRQRKYGKSKYGMGRFYTALCDLMAVRFVVGFRHKPMHFFMSVAIVPGILGLGLEVYVLAMKFSGSLFRTHMAALVVGIFLLLVAMQIISLGLLGELLLARGFQNDEKHDQKETSMNI